MATKQQIDDECIHRTLMHLPTTAGSCSDVSTAAAVLSRSNHNQELVLVQSIEYSTISSFHSTWILFLRDWEIWNLLSILMLLHWSIHSKMTTPSRRSPSQAAHIGY